LHSTSNCYSHVVGNTHIRPPAYSHLITLRRMINYGNYLHVYHRQFYATNYSSVLLLFPF